jgi:saccharopine dehydrogenase-like NADP-dependent oxidoreductase
MAKRVLIIGGYGNFGSLIAQRLARESALDVIVRSSFAPGWNSRSCNSASGV